MAYYTGKISKVGMNWGFITCEDESMGDIFVIGKACRAFRRKIPAIGTAVTFTIVTDPKTGKPRAEDVGPARSTVEEGEDEAILEAEEEEAAGAEPPPDDELPPAAGGAGKGVPPRYAGTVLSGRANNYGFIKQDSGEPDMFVLPPVPPVGTRVTYEVVRDPKTGRPRAEHVRVEGEEPEAEAEMDAELEAELEAEAEAEAEAAEAEVEEVEEVPGSGDRPGRLAGTMASINGSGSFGFIRQDSGEPDMFALPPLFPIGTRVTYEVIADPKTGRPRAEHVEAEVPVPSRRPGRPPASSSRTPSRPGAMRPAPPRTAPQRPAAASSGGGCNGYGPRQGKGRAIGAFRSQPYVPAHASLPSTLGTGPDGTPVIYVYVPQPWVQPQPQAQRQPAWPQAQRSAQWPQQPHRQPPQARWQGGPAPQLQQQQRARSRGPPQPPPPPQRRAAPLPGGTQLLTGTMAKAGDKFGFIKQDHEETDMFVFPPACEAFGRELPPVGTRVRYYVVIDGKTGRPRAEGVAPA